jgi:hypothetical protein
MMMYFAWYCIGAAFGFVLGALAQELYHRKNETGPLDKLAEVFRLECMKLGPDESVSVIVTLDKNGFGVLDQNDCDCGTDCDPLKEPWRDN